MNDFPSDNKKTALPDYIEKDNTVFINSSVIMF